MRAITLRRRRSRADDEDMHEAALAAQLEVIRSSHPGARFVAAESARSRPHRIVVSFHVQTAYGVRFGTYVLAADGAILAASGAALAPGDQLGLLAA